MTWIEEGRKATYKERQGHEINFLTEERLRELFGKKFNIVKFQESQEPETDGKPGLTNLITMQAVRNGVDIKRKQRENSSLIEK